MDSVAQVAPQVNNQDLLTTKPRKTHCPRGHEYTPDNTYVTNKGTLYCRICRRESERRKDAQERQARIEAGTYRPHRKDWTHCQNGHEYTPENTRIRSDGCRQCRTCELARYAKHAAKRPAPKPRAKRLLPPQEASLLVYLKANAGRPVTNQEIVTHAWKRVYIPYDDNNVCVHIRRLRVRLKDTSEPRRYIQTLVGQGAYMWIGPVESERAA